MSVNSLTSLQNGRRSTLLTKSEAVETLRLFVQLPAIPMGLGVQRLRSDRGTEYNRKTILFRHGHTPRNYVDQDLSTKRGFRQRRSDADRDGSVFTLGRRVSEVPPGKNAFTVAFLVNRAPQQSTAQGIGNGDPIQTHAWKGCKPEDVTNDRSSSIRARGDIHTKTSRQGLGRETLRLQHGQSSLSGIQPNDD